jgi:cytochrome b involved in lipid metabolism
VDEDVYDLTKFQDEHPGIFIYLVQHDRLRLTYHRWQER